MMHFTDAAVLRDLLVRLEGEDATTDYIVVGLDFSAVPHMAHLAGKPFKASVKMQNFIARMKDFGVDFVKFNTNPKQRAELQGQPVFKGLNGPMWDGDKVRYETNKVYQQLSQSADEDAGEILDEDVENLGEAFVEVERILAENGLEIEAEDVESYAESLLAIAESEDCLSLDEKDFFGKVGKGIRTLAHNIGRAQGAAQGVKDRWSNFKKGVFAANQSGRARGHAATSTDQTTKNQPKGKGNRPKGWKQQAQQQSFKAQNRGAKAGDKSTRKDGTIWQKEKDGSWTKVMSHRDKMRAQGIEIPKKKKGSGKPSTMPKVDFNPPKSAPKAPPKLRLVTGAEPEDINDLLDEILDQLG